MGGHRDTLPRTPFKKEPVAPAVGRAVSRWPPAVSSFREPQLQRSPHLRACLSLGGLYPMNDGATADEAWPFWPNIGQVRWLICAPELLLGLSEICWACTTVQQLSFSLCLSPPIPFHRCWTFINILYTKLHLSVCFWKSQSATLPYLWTFFKTCFPSVMRCWK